MNITKLFYLLSLLYVINLFRSCLCLEGGFSGEEQSIEALNAEIEKKRKKKKIILTSAVVASALALTALLVGGGILIRNKVQNVWKDKNLGPEAMQLLANVTELAAKEGTKNMEKGKTGQELIPKEKRSEFLKTVIGGAEGFSSYQKKQIGNVAQAVFNAVINGLDEQKGAN